MGAARLPMLPKIMKPVERWKITTTDDPKWRRWEAIEREMTELRIEYARLLIEKKKLRFHLLGKDIIDRKELTAREQEVLRQIQMNHGLTNKEIAARLNTSERMIKFHIGHLLEKCGVHSRHELPDFRLMEQKVATYDV
jgi:DNA-binding NarL/FixJ family response regulator